MAEKSLSPDRVVINWSAKSISFARQANFDDENREAIAEGYKAFERAFYKGDADAISRMYTEDAELYLPEAPVFSGRYAIAQVWRAIVGSGGNAVHVNIREVQDAGDWATMSELLR
jgi:ketosteroid isomerase-like protein